VKRGLWEVSLTDIVCFGDLLIDFVPTESGLPLADVPAFKKAPGGAAANVAVGLSRLGAKSAFMGKVGEDAFGRYLAGVIEGEGVDVSAMRFETRARTALAFVTLMADGERDFLFYRHPSADMFFTPDEVDLSIIELASIFHFDSISLAAEQPRETAFFAADHARATGKFISFDVNLRLPLWKDAAAAKQGIMDGLGRADVVKLSDDELDFLTGSRDVAAVRRDVWRDGMKMAILSLGREGSVIVRGDKVDHVPSFSVSPVDATGAGDGMVAGMLATLVDNLDAIDDDEAILSCIRFANAVGAITTTVRGAIPALPTRDQVGALLDQEKA
jgi:fructokinase